MAELQGVVEPGWEVYGSDDEKVGAVHVVGRDYLEVERGVFFIENLFVPGSAVADLDQSKHRVELSVTKDAVGEMGWTEPPVEGGVELGGEWGQGAPGGEDLGVTASSAATGGVWTDQGYPGVDRHVVPPLDEEVDATTAAPPRSDDPDRPI